MFQRRCIIIISIRLIGIGADKCDQIFAQYQNAISNCQEESQKQSTDAYLCTGISASGGSNQSILAQYQNAISNYQEESQKQSANASLYEDQYEANPNLQDPAIPYIAAVSTEINAKLKSAGIGITFPLSGLSNGHVATGTRLLSELSKYQATVITSDTTDTEGLEINSRIDQKIQQQINNALGRTDISWHNITSTDLGTANLPNDPAKQAAIFKQAASTLQTILSIVKQNLSPSATQSGYLDTRA